MECGNKKRLIWPKFEEIWAQSLFLFIFCFWFDLTKSTMTTYIGHGHTLRCDRAVNTRHVDSFSCYKSFLIAFAMRLYHWMVSNCYVFCWTTFGWLFYYRVSFQSQYWRFNVFRVFSYIKIYTIYYIFSDYWIFAMDNEENVKCHYT